MQAANSNPTATVQKKRPRKPGEAQPTSILNVSGALMKMAAVRAVTGRCAASIYRDVKAGTFPQPIKFGTRCTRWRADDVRAWLNACQPERAAS
jgi:prophage regulatory protein